MRSVRLLPVALALLLAGCATLSPPEHRSLAEVHALIDRTTSAYGVPSLHLLVGAGVRGVGGTYQRGLMTLSTPMLLSPHRDALIAHELAHYLLGHDAPLAASSALERRREQERRELDANARAVEILARAGRSEDGALRLVYRYLLASDRAVTAGATVVPWGHRLPCEEIADLLQRFPAPRAWSATLECAPSVLDANAASR